MGMPPFYPQGTLPLYPDGKGSAPMKGEVAVPTSTQLLQGTVVAVEAEEGSFMGGDGATEVPIQGVAVEEGAVVAVAEQEEGAVGTTDRLTTITSMHVIMAVAPRIPVSIRERL
ncbi:hypothetical protein AAFF_G00250050 [Aldrovandia affinis]|uniref:Uncharacterized protein n=1 Tax=Aldrovandia affinis TaxID=143900 RepID=A0AAD7RD20_9TELE|nr:hypothetical protein AAFF_G00250050 [Aldrovandia affinis]